MVSKKHKNAKQNFRGRVSNPRWVTTLRIASGLRRLAQDGLEKRQKCKTRLLWSGLKPALGGVPSHPARPTGVQLGFVFLIPPSRWYGSSSSYYGCCLRGILRRNNPYLGRSCRRIALLVNLAYGETGMVVDFPDHQTDVIEPVFVPGLPDEPAALTEALRNPSGSAPLRELVKPTDRVCIVISDITRPAPNHLMVPAILGELSRVHPANITLLVGTGMHRPNTPAELERMLGPDIVRNFRVVNHDCHDQENLVYVGRTTSGNEVYLNRLYVEADCRIVTGFIEPHFFAGFSGGPKAILPSIAGASTINFNHNAAKIADHRSTWASLHENPVHHECRQAAVLAPPQFTLNVTLNKERLITGVFAGELFKAHAAGCRFAETHSLRKIDMPYDVVVGTNSGYPLDLNIYQIVKGMSAASLAAVDGGPIVMVAECREGLGHGEYARLLTTGGDSHAILAGILANGNVTPDQWQVQIQAQIQTRHKVYLHSKRLSNDAIAKARLIPVDDVEALVRRLLRQAGPNSRVAVLPQGPQTIPRVIQPALA